MMHARYISEFAVGSRVDGVFALRTREMRLTRDNRPYLSLRLADKTGAIPGTMFDPSASTVHIPAGTAVRVTGRINLFRGAKRLSIDSMEPAAEWDAADLMASGPRPGDELISELRDIAATVRDREMKAVLKEVFSDHETLQGFCRLPASAEGHHAYLGGLVEHTVNVSRTCEGYARSFESIDRDLLVSAALLHDVGVLHELTLDVHVRSTEPGRLIGHTVLGVMRIREACLMSRVRDSRTHMLVHAVLAHHDTGAQGAVEPSSLEAVVLRQADQLDIAVSSFIDSVAVANRISEPWTGVDNVWGRALRVPDGARAIEAGTETTRISDGVAMSA